MKEIISPVSTGKVAGATGSSAFLDASIKKNPDILRTKGNEVITYYTAEYQWDLFNKGATKRPG